MLANRVSALLGGTSQEIQQVHQKMLNFYRFRSESLHDGNGSNITDTELKELEKCNKRSTKKSASSVARRNINLIMRLHGQK